MTQTQAYSIAGAVFVLDRFTKWLIESRFSLYESIPVIPGFFNLIYARNPGASFSLFAESTHPWRTGLLIAIAVAAAIVITSMLRKVSTLDRPSALGLALILGGALGNVFDRAAYGAVTDFLEFYHQDLAWPAFNVADSAIVCGAGLLLLGMWHGKREPAKT